MEELDIPRDMSRSAVFDVMVVLQNNEESTFRLEGVEVTAVPAQAGVSKYDLTFNFIQTAEGLGIGIEYNTDLFEEDRILRMLDHFSELAKNVPEASEKSIGELSMLPAAEVKLLLETFSGTATPHLQEGTIVSLFEQQAAKTPHSTALIIDDPEQGDRELTYDELNRAANRVAHHLRSGYGVEREDVVAFQVARGEQVVIAMLGILKSGAAYLPLGQGIHSGRNRYLLEDRGARVLLTVSENLRDGGDLEDLVSVVYMAAH